MAVHHFVAADLISTSPGVGEPKGWQPLDSFPRDGSTVEVCNAEGSIAEAAWEDDGFRLVRLRQRTEFGAPTHWRILKEEG